jgi:thiol-disulfide isomerase/thioredoxin
MDFFAKFPAGLEYQEFLSRHGSAEHQRRWGELHARVKLSETQQATLAGFKREMLVLCLAGAWCGDCVNQCPIFAHFAAATPNMQLRFFDRDTHPDLAEELKICGGARVPVVVFLSEDGFEVGRYGDRTLSKYRQLIADSAGAACPTGIVPQAAGLLDAVTQDWLNEFERAQFILRLSGRLRQKHGD